MSNVIFMVNLKETKKPNRTDSYKFSINSWKVYAERHSCLLYVLEERVIDEEMMNANWHKAFALSILRNSGIKYDKVLIVDSDTIPHPDAPCIFDVCTENGIHAVHNMGNYDWVIRSMENYSATLFNNYTFELDEYINTGVMVVDDSCYDFFNDVQEFYGENMYSIREIQERFGTGTDQPVLNFLIHLHNVPLHILPFEWNMQELPRLEILDTMLTFTKYGYVYHFNGISPDYKLYNSPESSVYQWMNFVYNKLYGN